MLCCQDAAPEKVHFMVYALKCCGVHPLQIDNPNCNHGGLFVSLNETTTIERERDLKGAGTI
jgi:hypothetical protein